MAARPTKEKSAKSPRRNRSTAARQSSRGRGLAAGAVGTIVLPEWDDRDANAEKPNKGAALFEDPDGLPDIGPFLAVPPEEVQWLRPAEYLPSDSLKDLAVVIPVKRKVRIDGQKGKGDTLERSVSIERAARRSLADGGGSGSGGGGERPSGAKKEGGRLSKTPSTTSLSGSVVNKSSKNRGDESDRSQLPKGRRRDLATNDDASSRGGGGPGSPRLGDSSPAGGAGGSGAASVREEVVNPREINGFAGLANQVTGRPPVNTGPTPTGFNLWLACVMHALSINERKIGRGAYLWENIYPKDKDGLPTVSPSGRYLVRVFVGGVWRRVTIDDRFPVGADRVPLLVKSVLPHELWPLLLAKAIMKVCLAYGDNQPSDPLIMHWLSGWMPVEQGLREGDNTFDSLMSTTADAHTTVYAVLSGTHEKLRGLPAGQLITISDARVLNVQVAPPPDPIHASADPLAPPQPPQEPKPKRRVQGKLVRISAPTGRWSGPYALLDESYWAPEIEQALGLERKKRLRLGTGKTCEAWIPIADFYGLCRSLLVYRDQTFFSASVEIPTEERDEDTLLHAAPNADSNLLVVVYTPPGFGFPPSVVSVDTYDWKNPPGAPLVCLQTSRVGTAMVAIPSGDACYRITVDAPEHAIVRIHGSTPLTVGGSSSVLVDRMGMSLATAEGTYAAQTAGSWAVWLKYVVSISQMTNLSAQLYVSDAAAARSTRLRVINVESGTVETALSLTTPPKLYKPGTSSDAKLIIVVDCRTTAPLAAGKWRLRLLSDKRVAGFDKVNLKGAVTEEGVYQPNRYNEIFRYVLKTKEATDAMVQVAVQEPNVHVKLELLDNDAQVVGAVEEGQGCATLPYIRLEPFDPKKPELYLHKYILQCTLLHNSWDPRESLAGRSRSPLPESSHRDKHKEKSNKSSTKHSTSANESKLDKTHNSVKKPSRKSGRASAASPTMEGGLGWSVSIAGNCVVEAKLDTEREDQLNAIKAEWESGQPGRASRARAVRERYTAMGAENEDKSVTRDAKRSGSKPRSKSPRGDAADTTFGGEVVEPAEPVMVNSRGTQPPAVLSAVEATVRGRHNEVAQAAYRTSRTGMKDRRTVERKTRNTTKSVQTDESLDVSVLLGEWRTADLELRDQLRAKMIAEAEAAAEREAALNAERKERHALFSPRKKSPRGKKRSDKAPKAI